MKLLCKLFGHKWQFINEQHSAERICSRCLLWIRPQMKVEKGLSSK